MLNYNHRVEIKLIAVGEKMPHWVQDGYAEFAKRLPATCALRLVEIAPGYRGKSADIARALRDEGDRILTAIPKGSHTVALDVTGRTWNTAQLSEQLASWMAQGQNLNLLIGGPDGLADTCLAMAQQRWSLSPLTFPHALVRILVAEQLYRAWSILRNHPYHRY